MVLSILLKKKDLRMEKDIKVQLEVTVTECYLMGGDKLGENFGFVVDVLSVGRYPTSKIGTRRVINRTVLCGTDRRRTDTRIQ